MQCIAFVSLLIDIYISIIYITLYICIYNNNGWKKGNHEIIEGITDMEKIGGRKEEECECNKLITETH